MNIKQKIHLLEQKIIKIKADLISKINDLPDNKDIQRINENCFIISFKSLKNVWTPSYYDFKYTYKVIIEEIEHYKPFEALERIDNIIRDKSIKNPNRSQKIHPQIIQYLKDLVEGGD